MSKSKYIFLANIFLITLLLIIFGNLTFLGVYKTKIFASIYFKTRNEIFYELWNISASIESIDTSSQIKNSHTALIHKYIYYETYPTFKGLVQVKDKNFLEGYTYIEEGSNGNNKFQVNIIKIQDLSQPRFQKDKILVDVKSAIDTKEYLGTLSQEKAKERININFNQLKNAFESKSDLSTFVVDNKNVSYDNNLLIKNIYLEEINFISTKEINKSGSFFQIGELIINMPNCYKTLKLALYYETEDSSYRILNTNSLSNGLCKVANPSTVIEAKCKDCRYFPVDKKFRLASNYSPTVRNIDFAGGAHLIHIDVYDDLKKLFEAADAANHNPSITSAYRSYEVQESIFNNYVAIEESYGKTHEDAVASVNTYSAIPGFSEHQLGTTIDINASQCAFTSEECPQNKSFWEWMENNAYKFGFIRSYPENLSSSYVYEPWHYRWIGKENAAKFAPQKNRTLLRDWLIEQGVYLNM